MTQLDTARKFEFNAIYVFESLAAGEIATGTALHNDIIARWAWKIPYLQSYLIPINSKQELLGSLGSIKAKTINDPGHAPFLHFEIHGSKEGLVLNSGELVTWQELTSLCREINIILRNNLFVSLATCYGAYIMSEILPSKQALFFAFIRPWEEIVTDDVMVSFTAFFDFILNGSDPANIDFNKAVDILNEANGGLIKFHHYNSEQVFESTFADHENNLWKPGAMSRRIKELEAKVLAATVNKRTISKSKLRKEIKDKLVRERHAIKAKMKANFMMQSL